jgi:serine/threonine-protein kinase
LALGGMGAVYLARTEGARGFSKPVVVKRILPIWGGDEEIVSLFAREARILSQLQDPGIVSVMDFGQIEDGTLVMVLDYVHGYHLAHWLNYLRQVEGKMPVEMAVHIMLRVLSALHYAHTFVKSDGKPLAVIHRDVSPTNILLDISGNVKLVDFGIARAEGDAEVYKTEAPQLRGKFGYLAPELFTGEPPTPQSDVYAAGVVLYELLTGDNPFRGREVTDSYHKVLNVIAPDVSSLRSDVSPGLAHVVATALAKAPADRYASAAAFADALRPERPAPDEACQARLRAAVQAAFAGPLADTLGIEPLSDADEAWRDGAEEGADQSLETAVHEPAQAVMPGAGVASPAPPANGQGSPRPPRQSLAEELGPALEEMGEEPTVRRAPRQSSLPPLRPTQLRLVVIASASLIGAFLVAGILRSLEHKEDRVIVIERESNTPQPTAVEADPRPPPAAPAASPDLAPKTKVAAAKASDAPAPAVGPEPARLTSAFAHQQSRIQRCFASHADAVQPLPELTIEFQVDASGAVERAELTPASAASSALGTCLLEVARSTRFPRLTRAVTFRIPIQAHVTQPAE